MLYIQTPTLRLAAMGCVPRPLLSSQNYITPPSRQHNSHNVSNNPGYRLSLSHPRYASTTSNSSATADPAKPGPSQPTTPTLTWNDFLYLRKVRRRYNQVFSATTALGTTALGISVLSQQNFEELSNALFGLEPIMAIGLCTTGFMAIGWLAGPLVAGGLFKMRHRKSQAQMALKEREFFERIKKYRVDPSTSSVSNPVPDYYGEKITSVGAYRQWLKDQRAFNRKRQSYV